MLGFASVLAGLSLWILLPEAARSSVRRLPTNSESAVLAATERARASWAASFAGIRGDLWTEAAFTYAASLWPGAEQGANGSALASDAGTIVDRALRYAPHESAVWLLAASLASRFKGLTLEPASTLKMSYYTGPNDVYLVPLRLFTATHSSALTDSDIQQQVQRDVRMILTRWPDLKPALAVAYRDAEPTAQRFLEAAVAETDPRFAETGISSCQS